MPLTLKILLENRAVDKGGYTIEFMLSDKRDRPAVLKFSKKASDPAGCLKKLTLINQVPKQQRWLEQALQWQNH
ncbi:hypothetical protein TUM19329_04980 [Legionella antarctica]|uniref:Uncharacterized protein n=1 Tax=Legionella antarctica TaxID=2708020 RepID=A0A6F8T1T7_9GAMM|nr:hypothetical protein [Legionella antarctica]BCA94137.1 hypothetical protein TUM19329_04980 [Legionella antarctica]